MTRMDFLKQLEYLLQDIDEKDREDALEYYRDYMDEAGISEFASVDGLLDVPEKIAISIRASLNDDSEEQNEFSEQGVSDSRWESQKHMPDIYKKDDWSQKEEKQTEGAWKEGRHQMMSVQSGRAMTVLTQRPEETGEIIWARFY